MRYIHTYPAVCKKRMQNYAKLFSDAENAKLLYNRDMNFRKFVNEWQPECVELLSWSLEDFYRQYKKSDRTLQLSLALA